MFDTLAVPQVPEFAKNALAVSAVSLPLCAMGIPIQNAKVEMQRMYLPLSAASLNLYQREGFKGFFVGYPNYTKKVAKMGVLSSFGMNLGFKFAESHSFNPLSTAICAGLSGGFLVILSAAEESRELTKLKRLSPSFSLKYYYKDVLQMVPLTFARSSISWIAAASSSVIAKEYHLTEKQQLLTTIALGFSAGVVSSPIDLVLTKSFGSNKSIMRNIVEHYQTVQSVFGFFKGALPRAMQIPLWIGSAVIVKEVKQRYSSIEQDK